MGKQLVNVPSHGYGYLNVSKDSVICSNISAYRGMRAGNDNLSTNDNERMKTIMNYRDTSTFRKPVNCSSKLVFNNEVGLCKAAGRIAHEVVA